MSRAPTAIPLARVAVLAAFAREMQRLVWTALPSDVIPGTRGWIAGAVCLASAALSAATWSTRD